MTVQKRRPAEYLQDISPALADGFKNLRGAIAKAGPLDNETCELILIASFACYGAEDAFKSHAGRLLKSGTPVEALRHAVVITLAATTSMFQVGRALQWIDEVQSE